MPFDFFSSQSPTLSAIPMPVWLDLAAVVVGSFSGLLYARERHLDLVGYVGLAILCGLGGGLIRDTIMQVGDVYMLNSQAPILLSIATAVVGFLFPASITAHPHLMEWVDILSVGLFAAAGSDKALLYRLNPTAIILMGTITGVGGGMLRDIFLGEVPHIFRRSNWYALCAIAGSAAYYLCAAVLVLDKAIAAVACVGTTLLLRRVSLRYDIYSPADVDLGPAVKRTAQTVATAAREVTNNEMGHVRQQRQLLHKRRKHKRRR
ncbi:MAG: TRIC cation channel family protein [Atopobiaceae bacterium]|nr:TRIC cation channel family protein [Atopobiaceae bacterium]